MTKKQEWKIGDRVYRFRFEIGKDTVVDEFELVSKLPEGIRGRFEIRNHQGSGVPTLKGGLLTPLRSVEGVGAGKNCRFVVLRERDEDEARRILAEQLDKRIADAYGKWMDLVTWREWIGEESETPEEGA